MSNVLFPGVSGCFYDCACICGGQTAYGPSWLYVILIGSEQSGWISQAGSSSSSRPDSFCASGLGRQSSDSHTHFLPISLFLFLTLFPLFLLYLRSLSLCVLPPVHLFIRFFLFPYSLIAFLLLSQLFFNKAFFPSLSYWLSSFLHSLLITLLYKVFFSFSSFLSHSRLLFM